MFDLPIDTKDGKKEYRNFIKNLTNDGYIRIQYSVYSKLCINNDSAITASKRLERYSPSNGDIRYLIITEQQYSRIVNVNQRFSLQEQLTTVSRTMMIGGMNDVD